MLLGRRVDGIFAGSHFGAHDHAVRLERAANAGSGRNVIIGEQDA
jgi:hypothetical protein